MVQADNFQPSKVETEIKFIVSNQATFVALQKIDQLDNFEIKPMGLKTMADHYVDTPDKRLFQAGYACRIRQNNGKQLLTLKSLAAPQGNVHRREEIEQEITAEQPQHWPEGQAKGMVLEIIGLLPLQLLFTIYQTRRKYLVLAGNRPVIEFSLDEVSLDEAGQIDYFELEAELIEAGTEADLNRFSDLLQERWPLQPQPQSKFERAFVYQAKKDEKMFKLDQIEETALEKIAGSNNTLLAKRAMIILMSNTDNLTSNIAKEVELTPRTVRHWQKAFAVQRLAIFPSQALGNLYSQSSNRLVPETATPAQSPDQEQKKEKPKKDKNLVVFPTRKAIKLKATDTLAEACRKILSFQFAKMLEHEPGTRLGENSEALHDMRVAVRRMRAALNIFGHSFTKKSLKPLQKGLKTTGGVLGEVRDLDVFIEDLRYYGQSLPEDEQAGLQPLLDIWEKKRETARREMLSYLDSKGYLEFKRYLLKFVKTKKMGAKPIPAKIPPEPYQVQHLAPTFIYEAYEKVRAYETILTTATHEILHELRKSLKELRYMLEFFQEILGDEKKLVLQDIKTLQDHLGNLNDANVASVRLRDLLAKWEEHQLHLPLAERQSPAQFIAYLDKKLSRQHDLLISFPQAWRNFNRLEFRQNLAKTISVL